MSLACPNQLVGFRDVPVIGETGEAMSQEGPQKKQTWERITVYIGMFCDGLRNGMTPAYELLH
jgi:hypothetical protein